MLLGPVLRPVGPLPAGVYWRRRAAVVAVAVALLVLLVVALRGLGGADRLGPPLPGGGPAVGPSPAGAPVSTTPAAPARSDESGATPTPTAGPASDGPPPRSLATDGTSATGAGGAVAARDCTAADVRVEVTPTPAVVPAGEPVTFAVRLAASGSACLLDVGPVARSARVSAGGHPVWSTEDCEAGDDSQVVPLVPGQPRELSVRWEGARTAPGCPGGLGRPEPGEHAVVVQVGPAVSPEAGFRLVRPQT